MRKIMSLMQVHTFPDPVLKQKAKPVTDFDATLQTLAADMLETMYHERGIGLAANQVAVLKRILVMDVQAGEEDTSLRTPRVLINPEIVQTSGQSVFEEGCLSVVEFTAEVTRHAEVVVRYQDLQGAFQETTFENMESICVQHEMDHLDGILFIDRLSPLKRKLVTKKLIKLAQKSA